MLTLDKFRAEAFIDEQFKPIVLAFVDGGPDRYPWYPKVVENAIDHFQKNNLDTFIVLTVAIGMSAYTYVEQKMAPLSQAFTGILILFGNHLGSQNRTIDGDINFRKAGELLAEILEESMMDGHLS